MVNRQGFDSGDARAARIANYATYLEEISAAVFRRLHGWHYSHDEPAATMVQREVHRRVQRTITAIESGCDGFSHIAGKDLRLGEISLEIVRIPAVSERRCDLVLQPNHSRRVPSRQRDIKTR